MFQWYKKVVFENYANFNGRARRKEYWYFALANIIVSFVVGFICGLLSLPDAIMSAYSLVILIPSIAVAVRRMHDVNKSGWFVLIPIYNLILACTEGTIGDNRFGKDPKGKGESIDDIGTQQ
ncbi:DUF805 domain-containing protein [Flavobacterium agricola]|uniref:DUF805 domain-containing protein n=1 Tax=Flavobacterium agricola TaxID=2870839 RepID=A0ABY6M2J1_9FLAO|nr:DUF805 domain-containing protein [Flavobacterium agricola]UYW02022.1 DUF805 domain-containing protein [Flavobacterium agricola]